MKKKDATIRRLRIIMAVVAASCAVIFVPWSIVRAWVTPLPDNIQAQVDLATKYGLDGIIVYVDQPGKPPALYAAGWKDKAQQVPADPNALFKIASISKLYIATAAAKLIHSQHLSLNDTLADHLPALAGSIENADQITLRMLLQHRSGIPNFTNGGVFPWSNPPTDRSDYLALVLDKPALFEPDARYRYSNTNYLLIGDIIDKTLGYSHHQFIHEEIVTPLALTETFSLLGEVDRADVVSGYYAGDAEDLKGLDYIAPGGSMVATARDTGVYLRALNDGSLLSEEAQAIYTTIYEYEHTGLLPGYQSVAQYHKDIDTVVIQFVNTSGKNSWTVSKIIYNRILKLLRQP